jgi:hypothetical protein
LWIKGLTQSTRIDYCDADPERQRMMKPPGPDSLSERLNPLPRPALRSLISGAEILAELPPVAALPLWEGYRVVHLWASTPRALRQELVDPDAERRWVAEVVTAQVEELEPHLMTLGMLFRDPIQADPVLIAMALRAMASWAETSGYLRSAALMAEAAAYATPADLGTIYHAAAGAKRAGWEPEAEAWYRYGLSLARQQDNGESKALFLSSLGNYYRRRGNLRLAERLHVRALRAARRVGATGREAAALHDLCYGPLLRSGGARQARRRRIRRERGRRAVRARPPTAPGAAARPVLHLDDRGALRGRASAHGSGGAAHAERARPAPRGGESGARRRR